MSSEQNLGGIYAAHAKEDGEPSLFPGPLSKIREARDMVYIGSTNRLSDEELPVRTLKAPRNKKQKRRRVSPFIMVLFLLGGAMLSVLYIGNILAVGHLMAQINILQTKHQQILNEQELLKAQINRLSGLERIQQLAHDQLGLQNLKRLPEWIEISPERMNEVEEVFTQLLEQKQ